MSKWVAKLEELKKWVMSQPSLMYRTEGKRLIEELEYTCYEESGARRAEESEHNFVAMTTARPPDIVESPNPTCTSCGNMLKAIKLGPAEWVIDHGKSAGPCPNDYKMWKIQATVLPIEQHVFVPLF